MAVNISVQALLVIENIKIACDPNLSFQEAVNQLESAHTCFERIQKVNDQKKFAQNILGNIAHTIEAFQSGDKDRIEINREWLMKYTVPEINKLT